MLKLETNSKSSCHEIFWDFFVLIFFFFSSFSFLSFKAGFSYVAMAVMGICWPLPPENVSVKACAITDYLLYSLKVLNNLKNIK